MGIPKSSHLDAENLQKVADILQQGIIKKCPLCQGEIQIPIQYGTTVQCLTCLEIITLNIEKV
ncbi:hypothetical protein IIU_05112 [Bacillus cereus VD133]|uniref:Uncharacterized protein n=1 Tax=Bacillus cereus VD133 TaxID=1053233 RepID=A0A9W5V0L4_BACCE|nr:hypothetical protein [Bacillus cereus]EOO30366.1 hypothetical protein IIU_05112 [Bacillus cereus VD133]